MGVTYRQIIAEGFRGNYSANLRNKLTFTPMSKRAKFYREHALEKPLNNKYRVELRDGKFAIRNVQAGPVFYREVATLEECYNVFQLKHRLQQWGVIYHEDYVDAPKILMRDFFGIVKTHQTPVMQVVREPEKTFSEKLYDIVKKKNVELDLLKQYLTMYLLPAAHLKWNDIYKPRLLADIYDLHIPRLEYLGVGRGCILGASVTESSMLSRMEVNRNATAYTNIGTKGFWAWVTAEMVARQQKQPSVYSREYGHMTAEIAEALVNQPPSF